MPINCLVFNILKLFIFSIADDEKKKMLELPSENIDVIFWLFSEAWFFSIWK